MRSLLVICTAAPFHPAPRSPPLSKFNSPCPRSPLVAPLIPTRAKFAARYRAHLAEIERRKLYFKDDCTSLFEFCVRILGYTESETLELLTRVQGRSTRETEKALLEKSPAMQARRETAERQRPITATLTEIKLIADEELVQLLSQARARLGHSKPTTAEVLKKALQALLKVPKTAPAPPAPEAQIVPSSRHIPVALKRELLDRAGYLCEFKHCTSGYALEFHHLDPYAYGGAHSRENLVVYCRAHHRSVTKV